MAYDIKRFDKVTPITVVADNTIDNTTLPINLIGKNRAGYGEAQNQNFVYLLENFAGSTPPATALSGQLWYDIANKKLKFNDGVGPSSYRTLSRLEVSSTTPTFDSPGDLWFDSTRNLLKLWTGKNTITIGPSTIDPDTNIEVLRLRDTNDEYYNVLAAKVIKEFVYIISSVSFTLKDSDDLSDNDNSLVYSAFPNVYVGLTLARTNITGVTTSDHRFWGTAMNAERLGGSISAIDSVIISATPIGFNIGNANILELQSTGIILKETNRNNVAGAIRFNSGIFEGYTGSNWVNFGGINGVVPVTGGGTGLSNCSQGQLIYGSNSNTFSLLDAGTAGYVLTMVNGLPKWNPLPSGVSHPSSGIAVSNGTTWNPSITIPNSTTVYLRGDGQWGTPSSVSHPSLGIAVSNGTTWNPSITIPNSTTVYLRGDGQWGTPSGGGGITITGNRVKGVMIYDTATSLIVSNEIADYTTKGIIFGNSDPTEPIISESYLKLTKTWIGGSNLNGANNAGKMFLTCSGGTNAQLDLYRTDSADHKFISFKMGDNDWNNSRGDIHWANSTRILSFRDTESGLSLGFGPSQTNQSGSRVVRIDGGMLEINNSLMGVNAVDVYEGINGAQTVTGNNAWDSGLPGHNPATALANAPYGIAIFCSGGGIAARGFASMSDYRLKTDINPLTCGLKFIDQAKPVSFKFKSENQYQFGFIAQDLLKAGYYPLINTLPHEDLAEYVDEDGFISAKNTQFMVDYEKVVPLLTSAIKEMKTEYDAIIAELREEINKLKNQ